MEIARQNWQNIDDQIWSSVDSSTITPAQIEIGDLEDTRDRYTYAPVQPQEITVLVSCEFESERSEEQRKWQIKKFFWRPKHLTDFIHSVEKNVIVLEGSEDYLGFAGETVATMYQWPDIWGQLEYQETNQRGVYAPKYKRTVIFSKSLSLKTSELPRWKPTAIIGKRNYEVEDVQ